MSNQDAAAKAIDYMADILNECADCLIQSKAKEFWEWWQESKGRYLNSLSSPLSQTGLFQKGTIKLNSGLLSDFKIDCDALTNEDIECLAYLISKKLKFREVYGVPTGGLRLEEKLKPYCIADDNLPVLICDDVLTTGNSMNRFRETLGSYDVIGVVIFSRGKCEQWIYSLFNYNSPLSQTSPGEGEDEKWGQRINNPELSPVSNSSLYQLGYNAAKEELQKQIVSLEQWKESANAVWPDMQQIGKLFGVRLGESIHDKIIPNIKALQSKIASLEQQLQAAKDTKEEKQ